MYRELGKYLGRVGVTDKEILAEVYRRLQGMASVNARPIKDFIEQEWQKQDELNDWRAEVFAKNDDGQMYQRHVGLEIDEDGTVTGIK